MRWIRSEHARNASDRIRTMNYLWLRTKKVRIVVKGINLLKSVYHIPGISESNDREKEGEEMNNVVKVRKKIKTEKSS